ncbi:hypothetical protein AB9X29_003780 [Vibrio vulnificus]
MLKFVIDIKSECVPGILSTNKDRDLLITSPEGQFLASYPAPEQGWNRGRLVKQAEKFPPQWQFCGAEAYLGDHWVGSMRVLRSEPTVN